jgi:hypothetical protein
MPGFSVDSTSTPPSLSLPVLSLHRGGNGIIGVLEINSVFGVSETYSMLGIPDTQSVLDHRLEAEKMNGDCETYPCVHALAAGVMARSVATVTVVSPIDVTNPVANAYRPDCGNAAIPESFPTVSYTLCGMQQNAFCSQTTKSY